MTFFSIYFLHSLNPCGWLVAVFSSLSELRCLVKFYVQIENLVSIIPFGANGKRFVCVLYRLASAQEERECSVLNMCERVRPLARLCTNIIVISLSVVRNLITARFKSVVFFIIVAITITLPLPLRPLLLLFLHFYCVSVWKSGLAQAHHRQMRARAFTSMYAHVCGVVRCSYQFTWNWFTEHGHMGLKWDVAPPQHHIFQFCQRISIDFHKN